MASLALTLASLSCLICAGFSAPEIQFSFGRVQGIDEQAQDTLQPYYAYYGIPFAEPPTGSRRFEPPVPYQGRGANNVITSTRFRPSCMQAADLSGFGMSEDCLFLNIFSPVSASSSTPKKVMFWIHGGAFIIGDATFFKPSRMVTDFDVIVVTIQYRLGPFGFLSTGKGDGNMGLHDQILALRWVKNNIGQFGGDSSDITIFGESAGSASVSLLSLSPLTKGLFKRAIMQSGVATNDWAIKKKPEEQFENSAEALGCKPNALFKYFGKSYHDDIWNCLRGKSAQEITSKLLAVIAGFSGDNQGEMVTIDALFTPVLDGNLVPKDPLSLTYDKVYLRSVGALDRDYILGFNNNEALVEFQVLSQIPGFNIETRTTEKAAAEHVTNWIKQLYPLTPLSNRALDLVDYEYTMPRPEKGKVPLQGLMDLQSDASFIIPTVQFARALTSAEPNINLYLYLFDHYPQLLDPTGPFKGTNHAMELLYEFDPIPEVSAFQRFYAIVPSRGEEPLFEAFRGALTTFAKTGNPARGINQGAEPRSWPRYNQDDEYYLAISVRPEVRQRVFEKRVALWTEVLPKIQDCSYFSRFGCGGRSLF